MEKKKYNAPKVKIAVMEKLMDETVSGDTGGGSLSSKSNNTVDTEDGKSTSWANTDQNN